MSGIEIFGLIAGIISVTETLINVYGAIKDLDELPAAFHEVNNRLPLVEQILLAAKAQTKNVTKEEAKAIEDILKGSKEKVDSLLKIFKKISARLEKKSVRTFYQKVVLKLGSGSRVETLMDNVLKDLQVLSTYHAFETAIGNQAAALEKAREEIAKVEPSVPDSVFEAKSGTAINHGKDQYNSFGGTLNKFDGDQFNAERDINFGTRPKKSKKGKGKKESDESSDDD
jgi:hypothetical protein